MSDTEERTEQPSPHRLRKAREEGDTATSTTLTIAIAFGSTLILLWLVGDLIKDRLSHLLSFAFASEITGKLDRSLWPTIAPMLWDALIIVGPFVGALIVASTIAGLIQNARHAFCATGSSRSEPNES